MKKPQIIYAYRFAGTTIYKGYPVYVLTTRTYLPVYCECFNTTAKIYIRRGLPIPLYATIQYALGEKSDTTINTDKAELPVNTIGAYMETEHY